MKNLLFLFAFLASIPVFSQATWQGGVNPEANQSATILFDKSTTPLASYNGTIYAHTGVTVNGTNWQNVIGSWGNNVTQPALTLVSGSVYKLDLTPTILQFYGVGSGTVTKVCVVFRNAAGNSQSADIFLNVGAFQSVLTAPAENSNTILNSGQNLTITATNTNGTANYNLLANGVSINTQTTASYSFTDVNITGNKNYELQINQGSTTFTKKFTVIVNPGTITATMPSNLEDGINYNPSDATTATLVLDAPGKDFIYVAGSFNNWQPTGTYAMKKDAGTGKFWLSLTGLTPGQNYTYQYWVVDTTPLAGSPALVKTADPYSTLVLSPFDDPWIPASTYPNLPPYPVGQEREVTVLKTGEAPYNWQVTNFTKPEKDKLMIYEVLVRDFDSDRNYQDIIDRISYFVNLKVNAIQLMPVMEFDGNESWGYNTSFHLANDKFYGPANKLRELIDVCHQNGIAVILDVALNHAFGRNPMNRMWMNDPDGDGWGGPSSESPYFNMVATHSYGVGNDFNHSLPRTKYYVKRVIKHWIQEYHIDGFRWDLTKGFTQNCTGSDACTNAYQADRVAVLKEYADYAWGLDPTHYTIFEHLGGDVEESEWANYRLGETPSKGIMLWGNLNYAYNQLSMGYNVDNDITRMRAGAHGFTGKRLVGYAESHDEERLMYKNLANGNSSNASHNVKTLNVALSRMSAIGAMSLLVPGPKMIWHFGELGWDSSIYTCNNGSVNTPSDATAGDCKLDTKPQPQWANNWLGNANRSQIYNDWARMIQMKTDNPVFNGNVDINSGTTLTPKLYIYDNSLPGLKNVVVLSNFNVTSQSVVANFPYPGMWFNLMDDTSFNVTNTAMTITIAPGQFKIFGNQPAVLANDDFQQMANVSIYPNPASEYFTISTVTSKVKVLSLTGQIVKEFDGLRADGFQFNVGELNSGLYLIKITNENGNEKTLRFIKQ